MHSEVESLCQRLRNYRPPIADGYGYPPGQEPREHHVICDEAASLIERLYRERDEAVALLAKVSRSLTGLTPGGSEYHSHSRDLDVYYADTEACERVIRDQFASGHKAKLEAVELRRALAEQPQ